MKLLVSVTLSFFAALLQVSLSVVLVLPLVPNYDECLLEIVAPVHLKDSLGLKDGDEVTLELYL